MPRELKLLFAGPMGAGKTTAIRAISDAAPVSTEVANLDQAQSAKSTTTVGLDYGMAELPGGEQLRLYGLPGQERFNFMWSILAEGALGAVLLADNSRVDPLAELDAYVDKLGDLARSSAMVIGVGRMSAGATRVADYADWLERKGLCLPVFEVDVRKRDDVLLLLEALLQQIETRELLR